MAQTVCASLAQNSWPRNNLYLTVAPPMKNETRANRDFRLRLQHELVRRCEKNPRYSLRSFAQQLGIYHATLSALIAGRRPVTARTIKKLGASLGITPQELNEYLSESAIEGQIKKVTPTYMELAQDQFNSISEWYYDAILELVTIKGFKNDPKWIAQVLGITTTESKIALESLERLELIKRNSAGSLELINRNSTNIIGPDFTSTAMKKYQKRILEKSIVAIDDVDKTIRDHTSTTLSIDPKDILQVKKLIKKFSRELTAFVQREDVEPKEVYQLQVSFFPLTKFITKRGDT